MKEQKLKRGILCLYIAMLVQVLSSVYNFFLGYSAYREAYKGLAEFPELRAQVPGFTYFGISTMWTVGLLVLTYFVIGDLKRGKAWAWIGAISILLVTSPSFALPASIFGLISLLDQDVRSEYLAKLDVKL